MIKPSAQLNQPQAHNQPTHQLKQVYSNNKKPKQIYQPSKSIS